jgi:Arc/MetJ family transcription regulator
MKTTIDIPEKELKDAMRFSRAKTKKEAVVAAISDYNQRRRLREMTERFGKSETFMSLDDLMRMRRAS